MSNNGAKGQEAKPAKQDTIQGFIFSRELAEVYLLLDNVAIDEGKSLPNLDNETPFVDTPAKAGGAKTSWIEQICEIGWPPTKDRPNKASDAAKLLRAKEKLNIAAAPATGYTIAFTFLIAGEATHRQTFHQRLVETRTRARKSWWSALGYLLFHDAGREEDQRHEVEIKEGWGDRPPSRGALARMAFPNLGAKARRYRRTFSRGVFGLALWLALVCFLSWDVATGSSLLNRAVKLGEAQATVQKDIAEKEDARNRPSPTAEQRNPSAPTATYIFCNYKGVPPPTVAAEELRLCEQRNGNDIMFARAVADLKNWVENPGLLRQTAIALYASFGIDKNGLKALPGDRPRTDRNAPLTAYVESAAVLIGVLAGVILPILYGVLGAGAAILRSLSAKMRDSTLSPRDLVLAPMQLSLGAVIGGCVGLFVTPDGGSADAGLIGPVHLSASALCFIAGFGVEGVFVALESFVKRVFNLKA